MKAKITAGIFIAAAFLLSAGLASAIPYTLNSFNTSGYLGPYGTVNVVLDSANQATITFTSENGYLFTGRCADAVNVNSSDFTASLISDNASAGLNAFSDFGGSQQVSEWGVFNLTVDQNNGSPSDRASIISFSVTDLAGTWGSAADVLDANSDGYTVAGHIIVPGGGLTGYAANGQTNNVPDGGSTALLLGAAISAIGAIRRKVCL